MPTNVPPESEKTANATDYLSEERLYSRHMAMAKIGQSGETGVNRQAFSEEDIVARRQLLAWGEAIGLVPSTDTIANLFLRYSPPGVTGEPVMSGSHLDSQPSGGRFDGVYGVLAALESIEAIKASGVTLKRPIELVAWSNEEGSRFAPGAMGSMVFAGCRTLDDFKEARDYDGVNLLVAVAATLNDQGNLAARSGARPSAYLEVHIEQGPVLEDSGAQIGIVTGIQGCKWFDIEVNGEARHAGTTPASARRDAVQAAAAIITTLYSAMEDMEDLTRFTIGRVLVEPGAPNTIASRVTFSIDLRHPDSEKLEQLDETIRNVIHQSARGLDTTVRLVFSHATVNFDKDLIAAVTDAAENIGCRSKRMMSGAFHDAMFMAENCPTSMIFVPSRDGISHHPDEYSTPTELMAGTRVLTKSLLALAS